MKRNKKNTMKKILLTLSFFAAATIAMAQTAATSNPNAPEITFDSKVIDYGTIQQNADGNRVFTFTNSGNEPLIITNTKGSCGCTVPTRPTEPIAPGATGEIKVKYDTKRVGPFTKTVTVTSNSSTPTVQLRIKGVVEKAEPVQTTPENTTGSSLIQN